MLTIILVLVSVCLYWIYIRLYNLKNRRNHAIEAAQGQTLKNYLTFDGGTCEEKHESLELGKELEALEKQFKQDESSFDKDILNSNPLVILAIEDIGQSAKPMKKKKVQKDRDRVVVGNVSC